MIYEQEINKEDFLALIKFFEAASAEDLVGCEEDSIPIILWLC